MTQRPQILRMNPKLGNVILNPCEVEVKLSGEEVDQLHDAAVEITRFKDWHRPQVTDRRHNPRRSTIDVTHVGLIGEFAVGRHLGLPVNTSASVLGDRVKDFTYCGMTVEVKTSVGVLPFNSVAHFKADLAILVNYSRVDYRSVWLQGWIPREVFRKFHFTMNFDWGDRACMQPASLRPMRNLRAWCLDPNRSPTGWIERTTDG